MAFGSLLSTNSTPIVLNPFLAARPSSTATSALPALAPQTAPRAAQSAPAPSSAPVRAEGGGGAHGRASAGGSGGVAAAVASDTATVYTTTVAGEQYSGSVAESDGQYTASVPNLPDASATGTTQQTAENNLDIRIDELV